MDYREIAAGFRHYVHLVYSRTLEIWLINGWEENTYVGTGVPPFFEREGCVLLLWYVTVCMVHGVVLGCTGKGGVTSL